MQQQELDAYRAQLTREKHDMQQEAAVLHMTERRATEFKQELRQATDAARTNFATEQMSMAALRDDLHAEYVDAQCQTDAAKKKWIQVQQEEQRAQERWRVSP